MAGSSAADYRCHLRRLLPFRSSGQRVLMHLASLEANNTFPKTIRGDAVTPVKDAEDSSPR
ncbi:hypothetical protein [Bythopirellula goksoeyrii]|uniref:hypothetical protein n=1 Tax=Bythopirellula goksoeyrii TaxID=1400387 RepID=UPI0011CE5CAD|nr:hypothetical protein [Bythopirellula goksoeyrii]